MPLSAKALGAWTAVASTLGELDAALTQARAQPGPSLIEVRLSEKRFSAADGHGSPASLAPGSHSSTSRFRHIPRSVVHSSRAQSSSAGLKTAKSWIPSFLATLPSARRVAHDLSRHGIDGFDPPTCSGAMMSRSTQRRPPSGRIVWRCVDGSPISAPPGRGRSMSTSTSYSSRHPAEPTHDRRSPRSSTTSRRTVTRHCVRTLLDCFGSGPIGSRDAPPEASSARAISVILDLSDVRPLPDTYFFGSMLFQPIAAVSEKTAFGLDHCWLTKHPLIETAPLLAFCVQNGERQPFGGIS